MLNLHLQIASGSDLHEYHFCLWLVGFSSSSYNTLQLDQMAGWIIFNKPLRKQLNFPVSAHGLAASFSAETK